MPLNSVGRVCSNLMDDVFPRSLAGQDTWLSPRRPGFESPCGSKNNKFTHKTVNKIKKNKIKNRLSQLKNKKPEIIVKGV